MKIPFESLPDLVATLIEQNQQIMKRMETIHNAYTPVEPPISAAITATRTNLFIDIPLMKYRSSTIRSVEDALRAPWRLFASALRLAMPPRVSPGARCVGTRRRRTRLGSTAVAVRGRRPAQVTAQVLTAGRRAPAFSNATLCRSILEFQPHGEFTALPRSFACRRHSGVMRVQYRTHQRQPNALTGSRPHRHGIGPHEEIENKRH